MQESTHADPVCGPSKKNKKPTKWHEVKKQGPNQYNIDHPHPKKPPAPQEAGSTDKPFAYNAIHQMITPPTARAHSAHARHIRRAQGTGQLAQIPKRFFVPHVSKPKHQPKACAQSVETRAHMKLMNNAFPPIAQRLFTRHAKYK